MASYFSGGVPSTIRWRGVPIEGDQVPAVLSWPSQIPFDHMLMSLPKMQIKAVAESIAPPQ